MSLIVVPFNAVIEPQDSVQNYDDVLFQNCGGAILTWWIESTVNFVRNGFKSPSQNKTGYDIMGQR